MKLMNADHQWTSPIAACIYMEKIGSAAMLAAKKSAGVALKANLRRCVICILPLIAHNAAHYGFEI